jgi:ParB-like chromosome segregation protein Spo0J
MMQLQPIALSQLHAHPANSNVMPRALLTKLVAHLKRTDRYPPLIVRPLPNSTAHPQPQFQIIDGHHRAQALSQLGQPTARCVVWNVDDDEALLLLGTLNRLQGRDDPKKRAALLDELSRANDVKALAALLPEQAAQLTRLLELNREIPQPRPPRSLNDMPVAVHFFVLPAERAEIEAKLSSIGPTREQALLQLIRRPN